jgi:hypothetical protein
MDMTRGLRRGWPRVPLAGTFALLSVLPLIQSETSVPPESKLTTVLADLARAVPQERARPRATREGPLTPLSIDGLPRNVRDAVHSRRLRIDSANEVQIYVLLAAVTPDNLRRLTAAGARVEITDAERLRVQARVPVTRLDAVAALPFVTFIRLPNYAVRRTGSVTTEGDAILRAAAARGQFSLDGASVKVGVLSDGIKGIFAKSCTTCGGVAGGPIATGDVPSATGTRNASGVLTSSSGGITGRSFQANSDLEGLPPATPPCGFAGAGAEGTALLEIVHDVAPAAQLSFANADTDMAFMQAVNWLAASNDVVVDDLGFYGDAYDGTSAVSSNTASALNSSSNRIRAYVTSVGNSADEHYIGGYVDSGVDGTSISGIGNSGHLHLFQASTGTTDVLGLGPQPYDLINLPTSGEVVIFLTWDDPFGASGNNYDLYLVRQSTGSVVAKSTDVQKGTQDPLEVVDYVNSGASDLFRIVVQNAGDQAQPKTLNIFSFAPECAVAGPRLLAAGHHERQNYNTASQSVPAQSDAGGSPVSVISAGAICSASASAANVFAGSTAPDESCLDTTNSTIEFFSSRGPTLDGRTKPDVAGIDGVSVTAAGSFDSPFFGTSAAAPHIAGIAALLLQAAPCLVDGADSAVDNVTARSNLRNLITGNAVALGGSVPNSTFGSGRADAFASVQKTLPVFKGASSITLSGNTPTGGSLTAADVGFSDPNQCALTKMSWTGGCGSSPGATLQCPFGTSNVSVAASNNGLAFSDPANVQITVTNFAVGASPGSATVTAGQSAAFVVTVSPQGGPFTGNITLSCSDLPFQASCSFNPPTLTPGTTSKQSTLTVSTTARSASLPPPSIGPGGPSARKAPLPWSEAGVRTIAWLVAAMLIVTSVLARNRVATRPRLAVLTAALLAVAFFGLQVACGGGSSSNSTQQPTNRPAVSLSPTSLTFGAQAVKTTSAPQSVTLSNTGNAALSITSIAASGDFAQSNTCGSSVAASASCSISVTFTPSTTGQRTGTITISDNASNSPQSVGLSGTGQAGGTPAGSYPIGIVGTAGTLAQSNPVTLVVQ